MPAELRPNAVQSQRRATDWPAIVNIATSIATSVGEVSGIATTQATMTNESTIGTHPGIRSFRSATQWVTAL